MTLRNQLIAAYQVFVVHFDGVVGQTQCATMTLARMVVDFSRGRRCSSGRIIALSVDHNSRSIREQQQLFCKHRQVGSLCRAAAFARI